ncbi:hypothetical protein [Caldisericum sp.]|uniref:hypothetical protein n=1 Tax=Caldisericum sp. TaxID=2499687 RepID=UPI003D096721
MVITTKNFVVKKPIYKSSQEASKVDKDKQQNSPQENSLNNYIEVKKIKGNGISDSEAFFLKGPEIKMVMKIYGDSNAGSLGNVTLESDKGDILSGNVVSVKTKGPGDGYNETIVRGLKAGKYYISVISDTNWEITLYEEASGVTNIDANNAKRTTQTKTTGRISVTESVATDINATDNERTIVPKVVTNEKQEHYMKVTIYFSKCILSGVPGACLEDIIKTVYEIAKTNKYLTKLIIDMKVDRLSITDQYGNTPKKDPDLGTITVSAYDLTQARKYKSLYYYENTEALDARNYLVSTYKTCYETGGRGLYIAICTNK